MTYRRFAAVASKEIIQIMRDTRSLIIVVLMPIILVLLFGYGVSLDVKHVAVYVFDREGSQQSQDLLKRFQASEYFSVKRTVNNYAELIRAIDDGHAKLGLVIPPDFSERSDDYLYGGGHNAPTEGAATVSEAPSGRPARKRASCSTAK